VLKYSAGAELQNHEQKLIFQADGNLVHYSGESVVWSPGCKYVPASDDCILKSDGTLVIYRSEVMMMRIGVPSDSDDVNTSYTIEWDDTGNQCFKIVGTGDTTTSTLLNSSVFVWRYSDYDIFGPGEHMAELDDGTSLALSSFGILEHLYSDGNVRMALNVATTAKAVACRVESDGTVVLYADIGATLPVARIGDSFYSDYRYFIYDVHNACWALVTKSLGYANLFKKGIDVKYY